MGWEYSYGYNDEDMTGVFSGLPTACDMHSYRESLPLGHITISAAHVDKILAKMEELWHGWEYHMLTRNCVNFTEQLCRELGMGEIPRWCGRAARAVRQGPSLLACHHRSHNLPENLRTVPQARCLTTF